MIGAGLLGQLVERRLGGYRQVLHEPDVHLPERVAAPPGEGPVRACVIGGGIAGITAAVCLAERGVAVELREAADHLGGKLGAWTTTFPGGEEVEVEHGFHAFFRQYYNLDRLLRRLGARGDWKSIDEYRILTAEGGSFGFGGLERAPILNLLTLPRTGLLRLGDLARDPRLAKMRAFLSYDPVETFAAHDQTSFATFAAQAAIPPELQLVFTSFTRAFFSDPHAMSLAEMIKSFHFYFLGHDHGLDYDYPREDHGRAILMPLARALEARGVRVRLGTPVGCLAPKGEGVAVDGDPFDAVVLACDVVGARRIAEGSPALAEADPALATALGALRTSGRYAVLRLWTDVDAGAELPDFVVTDRRRALDSISFYHRIGGSSEAWVAARGGGGVYELHSYHVPVGLADEGAIREALLDDLFHFVPALRGAKILSEHLRVGQDFTSFGLGSHALRPGTSTEVPALLLAGDWVKLPCPAMLMEAACTSGLLAVNALSRRWGVRGERVETIPLRGLLRP